MEGIEKDNFRLPKQEVKKFYSRQELEEFRHLITEKLEESQNEYRRLSESLKAFGGASADSFKVTEYGNESREKEQLEILMARQQKFNRSLENALVRIENGTYGICRITGELIPKERLMVIPHATTTVGGKALQNQHETIDHLISEDIGTITLCFNMNEYDEKEIAEGLEWLSEIYRSIGGDGLKITSMKLFAETPELAPVL